MRHRVLLFLGILSCSIFLLGCAAKKEKVCAADVQKEEVQSEVIPEKQAEAEVKQKPEQETAKKEEEKSVEEVTEKEEQEPTQEEVFSYPSEDAGSIQYDSPLGYSCMFDPTVFVLDDTGEGDHFSYKTAEVLSVPVYVAVLEYADMDAQALIDGIVHQSGVEGLEAQDTYFGADSILSKNIYIEKEVNDVTQIQTFYAIPSGEGSLLVEIGGYVEMPSTAEHKLEEITGTFSLAD